MNFFIRVADSFTSTVGKLASLLILPIIAVICYDVFCRYVLSAPNVWAFDICYMLTGSYFLLGAAYTLKVGGHIREDIFYRNFSKKKKVWSNFFGLCLLSIPATSLLTWILTKRALSSFLSGELSGSSAWNPPIWPFYSVFAISFFLLAIQSLAELFRLLHSTNDK